MFKKTVTHNVWIYNGLSKISGSLTRLETMDSDGKDLLTEFYSYNFCWDSIETHKSKSIRTSPCFCMYFQEIFYGEENGKFSGGLYTSFIGRYFEIRQFGMNITEL